MLERLTDYYYFHLRPLWGRSLRSLGVKPSETHQLTEEGSHADFWVEDKDIKATETRTAVENAVWLSSHLRRPPHLLLRTVENYEAFPAAVKVAIANPRFEIEWVEYFMNEVLENEVPDKYLTAGIEGLLERWQFSTEANPASVDADVLYASSPGIDYAGVKDDLSTTVGLNEEIANLLAQALTQGSLAALDADLVVNVKRLISAYAECDEITPENIEALIRMDEREQAPAA